MLEVIRVKIMIIRGRFAPEPDSLQGKYTRFTNKFSCSYNPYRLLPPRLSNRRVIIEQLCNSKVFTVRRITLQWAVKVPGRGDVIGRADSGRVKITPVGRSLEVYLRKVDSDLSRPPLELLEELSNFCQFTNASQVALLHGVMTEIHAADMDAIFQRRGLPNDAPEFCSLVNSRKLNPEFWSSTMRRNQGDADYSGDYESTFDAVASFMSRFTALNQWDNAKARPWSITDTDLVLSHLCRLENVDPYSLLPQTDSSPWNRRIREAGAYLDDPTSISFLHDVSEAGKRLRDRPMRVFPALVTINRAKHTVVKMLPDPTIDIARDIMLAGEVYVCLLLMMSTWRHGADNLDRFQSC
jgi:hypothetical protein